MTRGAGSTNYDGSTSYPGRLAALANMTPINQGVGGESSTQISARLQAAPASTRALPSIIWAGRNNFTSPSTVLADVASMVAALGHERYLVLGIINRNDTSDERAGGGYYATIVQLNSDLATTYGERFVDVRAHLVSLYNPSIPQDVVDHGHDVPPSSLTVDGLHLNDAGYQAVADKVYESIAILDGN